MRYKTPAIALLHSAENLILGVDKTSSSCFDAHHLHSSSNGAYEVDE
jgi:hypothetical protein